MNRQKERGSESRAELRSHGVNQIEIKTRYPLRNRRKTRYEMDVYIVTPHQLGLDKDRYGTAAFYQDLKDNTRYTINEIPLEALISRDGEFSPLARIYAVLAEEKPLTDAEHQEVLFELKSLTNYFSTQVKYTYRKFLREFRKQTRTPAELGHMMSDHLEGINQFIEAFRRLFPEFQFAKVAPSLYQALVWSDESISLTAERMVLNYYLLIHEIPEYAAQRKAAAAGVEREKKHRSQQKYISADIDGDTLGQERGIERESLLKKWAQSVLYLTNRDSKVDKGIAHVFAGTAAAVAMSIAVLLTFFADTWFSEYTLPWALVIVVSYILKDRIKEIARGVFASLAPRLISDRTEKLVDQRKDETVGKSRRLVTFQREHELPEEIRKVMDERKNALAGTQPEGNVIWLKKTLSLKSGQLLREHSRVNSVTEIIRLTLDSFLELMDSPLKGICRLKDSGELEQIPGNRVYHCDIFVSLSDTTQNQVRVFWYDVVLTQKGLLRIEQMNY